MENSGILSPLLETEEAAAGGVAATYLAVVVLNALLGCNENEETIRSCRRDANRNPIIMAKQVDNLGFIGVFHLVSGSP